MNVMDGCAQADDRALAELRADFPAHRVWRARTRDGRPGDWVATLHDAAAGVEPTVIRENPARLREALVEDRERAGRGARLR